ncbi:Ig-like domain-containing protein [Vibrio chagasii]|uniref:Ig-like domain-containing protein n=1 Tax=Vibrio chagasii TaxID=170679 RepID=UPI00406857F8
MRILNKCCTTPVYLSFVVLATYALYGCGGEGGAGSSANSGSNNQNQTLTLSAQDASYSTEHAELFEVDLTSKVFSSNGSGFTLNDVEVLSNNNNCQIESKTDSTFVIKATDTKVCNYRYHVTPKASVTGNHSSQASFKTINGGIESASSAITRVAVSSNPNTTELIPVSDTALVNDSITVNLEDKLKNVGYDLGSEFELTDLVLPYGHSSSAEINANNNQLIDYTPEQGFTGIDRVLYTLEDTANGLVLMGIVDIAIGYEANQGFTITENIEYPDTVDVSTSIEIDISEFVSSDDGDDFQLVYVESFNAEATLKDPLDITNKIIIFQASTPGYHYISFAVSDHNGVYDMGLIRVEVVDPNQSARWGAIPHLADLYTAPLTAVDAANKGLPYDSKVSDSGYTPAIDMAGLRYVTADTYCKSIGASLPTLAQLTQMTTDIKVQAPHNWPVKSAYLAYDDVSELPAWVDLSDNAPVISGLVTTTDYYYGTCIKQGLVTVLPESDTEVVADGVDVGRVIVELKLGNEVRPNAVVTASVTGQVQAQLDNTTQTTNNQGVAEFQLTSLKAETVTLTLDVGGVTETHDVKFIGDEKTAEVKSEATIDTAPYTSAEGGEVTATLTDENSNPIVGYSVTSEVSSGIHPDTQNTVTPILIDEAGKTDESGEQKFRVKWDSRYATPTTNMTFDVTSSYTTSTDKETNATSKVTFNAYLCGGQVGDDDVTNAAGACIKIAENDGKLFTGTPSVPFLQAIGYSGYIGTFTEDGSTGPSGSFARFTNSEAASLCTQYNTIKLNGKSDWRLATSTELSALFSSTSSLGMFAVKGWATNTHYWSLTQNGSDYYDVSLYLGYVYSSSPSDQRYASCVSGS